MDFLPIHRRNSPVFVQRQKELGLVRSYHKSLITEGQKAKKLGRAYATLPRGTITRGTINSGMKADLVITRMGKKTGKSGNPVAGSTSHKQSWLEKSSARTPEEAINRSINDVSKYWVYNWVLEIKNLESWYDRQSGTSKSKSGKGALLSLASFSGGKSHVMKKIRERSNDLLMKTVPGTINCVHTHTNSSFF